MVKQLGMTDEQLVAIEERANSAARGPWKLWGGRVPIRGTELFAVQHIGPEGNVYILMSDPEYPPRRDFYGRKADLEFVACARTDVPALIAEVRRLREVIRQHEERDGDV